MQRSRSTSPRRRQTSFDCKIVPAAKPCPNHVTCRAFPVSITYRGSSVIQGMNGLEFQKATLPLLPANFHSDRQHSISDVFSSNDDSQTICHPRFTRFTLLASPPCEVALCVPWISTPPHDHAVSLQTTTFLPNRERGRRLRRYHPLNQQKGQIRGSPQQLRTHPLPRHLRWTPRMISCLVCPVMKITY